MSVNEVRAASMTVTAHVETETSIEVAGFEPDGYTRQPFVSVALGVEPARFVLILPDLAAVDCLSSALVQARITLRDLVTRADTSEPTDEPEEAAGQPANC